MIPRNLTDDQARDLSSWVTELHQQCVDQAKAFFEAHPDRRFVQVQPTVPGPDGEAIELGEPILFSRQGLGL
ncbi:MAG: hypothetical protein ACRED4_06490 [Brevundimonas sp.]